MTITAGFAFAGEIGRDGRFIAYDNGTVLDTRTNLMWAEEDSDSDFDWWNAKSYCENYRGGGYTDWRMPTQDELAGLYDAAKTYTTAGGFDVHLTELIHLSSFGHWSSEARGAVAAFFNFHEGAGGWHLQPDISFRSLPVRSGK
jgi:hypothetical protein